MNIRTSFVADAEATELMEPREGSLHDPSMLSQTAAVFGATLGDIGADPAAPELLAMGF